MGEVKHVLGISGGKDSAALAIYLNEKYSKQELPIEYYTCDTGRELDETYELIDQLEVELRQKITTYQAIDYATTGEKNQFDFLLKKYGGFLPSHQARWCTKNMKLEPFEKAIGDTPTISYVGIRGDEDREGYISTKPNIQSIFPFRRNIWSIDVTVKFLHNSNREQIHHLYKAQLIKSTTKDEILEIVKRPTDKSFQMKQKLDLLLNRGTILFNKVMFDFLKTTDLPAGRLENFPLIYNEDVLIRKDIYDIIEKSNVDLPRYYLPIEYEIDGELGKYFRSRSGCFFCFYQQKIEWVWLLEQHPDLFWEAETYEKDGYKWIQGESLKDLADPKRVREIKREHLNRMKRRYANLASPTDWQDQVLGIQKVKPLELAKDKSWLDEIIEAESDLCANCFI